LGCLYSEYSLFPAFIHQPLFLRVTLLLHFFISSSLLLVLFLDKTLATVTHSSCCSLGPDIIITIRKDGRQGVRGFTGTSIVRRYTERGPYLAEMHFYKMEAF